MDGPPQIVLEFDADLRAVVAAAEVGGEAGDAREHEQDQHRTQRTVAMDDAVIEDLLLDQREQADERLRDDREDQCGDHRRAIATDERTETAQPADTRAGGRRPRVRGVRARGRGAARPAHFAAPRARAGSGDFFGAAAAACSAMRSAHRASSAWRSSSNAANTASGWAQRPTTSSRTARGRAPASLTANRPAGVIDKRTRAGRLRASLGSHTRARRGCRRGW